MSWGGGDTGGVGELRARGCPSPRGELPERESNRTEIGVGGPRAVIKGMRVWQSEKYSSKIFLGPLT